MALTSKIFLDDRRTKKDGTQPLKLRITIDRKSIEIPLGYTIQPAYWDDAKKEVKKNCPAVQNVTRLNNLIKKRHSDAVEKVIQLQDSGEINVLSMKDIKNRITGKRDETFIIEFTNSIIEELEEGGKVGNARVYKTMRNSIRTFLKHKDIPIKQITFKWLKKYEAWYESNGNYIKRIANQQIAASTEVNFWNCPHCCGGGQVPEPADPMG